MAKDRAGNKPLTTQQQKLVMDNIGLVGQCLGQSRGALCASDYDDLFQDGVVGLIDAIQRHVPGRHSLSTFARPRIRQHMRAAPLRSGHLRLGIDPVELLPSDNPTDKHTLRAAYMRAVEQALVELYNGRLPRRYNARAILAAIVLETILVNESYRTSIRDLAKRFGVSKSHIFTWRKRLLLSIKTHFAQDSIMQTYQTRKGVVTDVER